ncbi:MAG: hypothetical protein NXI24_12345 [bacterium]|nr:hypothetical protein [bacterium]
MKYSILITAAVAAVLSLLIFAVAWAGQSEFLGYGQTYIEAKGVEIPGEEALRGRVPLSELLFFLKWSAIILFLAFVRNITLTVFGIAERPFLKCLSLAARSALPMVIIGGILAIAGHLWPLVPASSAAEVADGQLVRVIITAVLVFLGWLAEGFATVRDYRAEFTLETGNAIVVFLAPWLVFVLIPLFFWFYRPAV